VKPYYSLFLLILITLKLFAVDGSKIQFSPINHASFIIQKGDLTIFVDPVGDPEKYSSFSAPQLILVTHDHGDHFDSELLGKLKNNKTIVVAPKIVTDKLGYGKTMNNGGKGTFYGIEIEAVPSYNTTPERMKFHPKGTGNGYVLTIRDEHLYISGDTENIPEMKNLKNIDYAFICMNLPYTMSVEQAASAVLTINPKHVFPYHYRLKDGFSNLDKFKELVSKNPEIKVDLLKWY